MKSKEGQAWEGDYHLPLLTAVKKYKGILIFLRKESVLDVELTSLFAEENCKCVNEEPLAHGHISDSTQRG